MSPEGKSTTSMPVAERVLDAAGDLFLQRGLRTVGMREIAAAAGISRATLYRYFSDRRELQLAYVHREARRIGAHVAREVARVDAGEDRLVVAVLSALRQVRATPLLAGWITSDSTATTASLVGSSEVMKALGVPFTGDDLAAKWLLRAVFVLLLLPGESVEEERAMVQRFLSPLVAGAPTSEDVDTEHSA